ncbi:fungal-specific transcription factor domain-containing protein [Corynascus novoguineensis]|uniref:Fungal-specific transcription factor domain-containing protein n=1 Tax=Corynascus novoguineensis TaxID=1126955 RepID=A0AAN7CUW4_9PEZI|nr:fungal-specific transcription factor domain-containing protein [Corynascus novoguineensis]
MPGILPMKVIKVGTSSQSRIAQACDRCRSKKIRCDGIRPTCTQCANVGFECRTSDKLSRRAFPRGYTESLEERVRALEAEVRELKDLLDEKDEKIDMLSRMHGNRQSHGEKCQSQPTADAKKDPGTPGKQDTFRVQASPLLLGVENSDSYFMGASSGRGFIESLKRKMQESGKSCSDFNPEAFLHIQGCYPLTAKPPSHTMRIPPRLFSDRCVNVYFQEWAPLFPVLHKPTFLRVYEEFVADPEKIKNNHKLAQLYLVFGIAALSSEQADLQQIAACEQQWQRYLEAILMDNTMMTLQCLLLALIYCTIRADYKRLQHYKGIAVGLSLRLGLHQSQKRFSFGVLTIETRKKVFWTLYTLDCFSAAILGLPKLLKEDDVHTEFPSDTDDEYVTEKGFQPSLPGEATRLSNALALFRGARILGKVLERIYPSATSHELSLQQMSALAGELDDWYEKLPPHLKLTFKQDKPSTDVTGSRSPILALAYYYTRTLIFRPAVTSSLGPKAAPALIAVSDASKHIIQIIQLLEERSMSYSLCLNKADTLVLCGMVLLFQTMDLKQDSKMLKENEKLVNDVLKAADKAKAPGCYDLKRIAGMLITVDEPPPQSLPTPPRQSPDACLTALPTQRPSATAAHKPQSTVGRHIAASISETDLLMQQEKLRRMTMPHPPQPRTDQMHARPRGSFDSQRPSVPLAQRDHRLSLSQAHAAQAAMLARLSTSPHTKHQAIEYLHLDSQSQPDSPVHPRGGSGGAHPSVTHSQQAQLYSQLHKGSNVSTAEWEALLGSIEGGHLNVYDAIYGGPGLNIAETQTTPVSATPPATTTTATATNDAWSPDSWDLTGFSLGDFGSAATTGSSHSVVSLSEDGLSSSEDMGSVGSTTAAGMDFRGGMGMPVATADAFVLDGLDGAFPM